MNINDFMPPVETMIVPDPRQMTYAERREQARVSLAQYVCAEMQFHRDPSVKSITLRENGWRVQIEFCEDNINVNFDRGYGALHLAYETDGYGVQDWLVQLNPCFGLRIVKLLEKARLDNRSRVLHLL
jgi:hypothetical protein